MTKISILGCGWLGLPLAKALLEKGFSVNGSTTSTEKLSTLENAGISPFLISLDSKSVSGFLETFLQEIDTLIIDIPPKLRGINSESFVEKIATLIPSIEKSAVKNVVFISSTSVYGEENDIVNEETLLNPDTESGKQLVEVEQLLQSNVNFKTTVIRFGGLIGGDRHPVKFLAGRENLDNPEAPINLIHQEDCIGIILKIIETDCWNETFNAAAPFHPSRSTYYTQKATDLNLALPKFNYSKPSKGKIIQNDKVVNVLKYTFTKADL
jgi:nucleoside-diphosphate-sugar epimerase